MKTICSLLLLLALNAALGSTLGSPGLIDPTFALTNNVGYRTAIALQQDGKVLVGGPNSPYLIRVHPNGSIDSSFSPAFRGSVQQVLVTSNNAIIVRGSFYRLDSQPLPPIVRRGLADWIREISTQASRSELLTALEDSEQDCACN